MSYSNKEVTSMLQRTNQAKEVNQTIADIIVAQFRARCCKTGKTKASYDEFEIQEIAQALTPDWHLASTYGVYEVLNTVQGIRASYDSDLQIGPCEWLEQIHIELD